MIVGDWAFVIMVISCSLSSQTGLVLNITCAIMLNFIALDIQVERLCDRVQSSTLLEDRRDAVRALKSLSKVVRV